jgi:hypothetical protein
MIINQQLKMIKPIIKIIINQQLKMIILTTKDDNKQTTKDDNKSITLWSMVKITQQCSKLSGTNEPIIIVYEFR